MDRLVFVVRLAANKNSTFPFPKCFSWLIWRSSDSTGIENWAYGSWSQLVAFGFNGKTSWCFNFRCSLL